jgi:mono/diheme cytochrome c family protein
MRAATAAIFFLLTAFELTASAPIPELRRSESLQATVRSKPERSVWHGVYSDAQQKRGEPPYVRECSTCHGETLKGGEGSPALTGPEFLERWNGRTLGDLFDNIRQTMPPPPDRPGKLTPQQHADVIAYILKANNFPASSDTQLPTDIGQLRQIRITTVPAR